MNTSPEFIAFGRTACMTKVTLPLTACCVQTAEERRKREDVRIKFNKNSTTVRAARPILLYGANGFKTPCANAPLRRPSVRARACV